MVRGLLRGGPIGNPEGRRFDLRLFNDRDVNVSLWDPKVEFYKDGKLVEPPMVPLTQFHAPEESGPIDLPSRTTVLVAMHLEEAGERLARLKLADRIRFVATVVPRGGQLSGDLPLWDPVEPLGEWQLVR
ncbi:MAG: hypothetical protein ICV68_17790 [Pyrinomonadaceae bacterium]|nr:hypothetical protein [Pyrinomonadaceae bacterium]